MSTWLRNLLGLNEEKITIVIRRSSLCNDDGTPISDETCQRILTDIENAFQNLNRNLDTANMEEDIRG